MLTKEQIAGMPPADRARLRSNCENALGGPKEEDALSIIHWIDEIEETVPKRTSKSVAWHCVQAGHHEGTVNGIKRFELVQGETDAGAGKVWAITLDGQEIAQATYVKDAKARAEEEAERLAHR